MHTESQDHLHHKHKMYKAIWNASSVAQKGTFPVLTVFKHTRSLVSVHVPVSCGIIEPTKKNFDVIYPLLPVCGQIEHDEPYNIWLLLSYHSLNLNQPESKQRLSQRLALKQNSAMPCALDPLLSNLQHWCEQRLLEWGIKHNDIHLGNMLWCNQLEAVVLIDFECTTRVDNTPIRSPALALKQQTSHIHAHRSEEEHRNVLHLAAIPEQKDVGGEHRCHIPRAWQKP